jgi:NAD(P)-dependent dehydrogenase (short-subunit alcohol dehydrogenase family)
MRLKGKVALITGGARGIGRATAELFAREGAKVHVGDLSFPESFEHQEIVAHKLDVTSLADWRAIVDKVIEADRRIDVLFNNAGTVLSYDGLVEISLDAWNKVIDINQNGPFYGMRTVIPHMKRAGGGSIINTSSIWGKVGAAGVSAYTASKAAVSHMSKNAALTYAADNIRVNSLHPGIIDTPMIAAQDGAITQSIVDVTPMKRLGKTIEIAYGALFLASDESSYMTGAELVIDGGYTTP